MRRWETTGVVLALSCAAACSNQPSVASRVADARSAPEANVAPATSPSALPPASTGGFDGSRAFEHVRHLVALGPRPPGSDAIHHAQAYIADQLKSYGCPVEEHDFHGSTIFGNIAMRNITAKIPGSGSGIVLYATHYDTLRLPDFVGADDGGSGTGTLLELARVLCARKNTLNVWITFFDAEESQGQWTDKNSVQWSNDNSTYGSREMAATMALSGDLKRLQAMILVDMIGPANLRIKRDKNSTPWLVDLIWATAARLGYANIFVDQSITVSGDDHLSFIHRGVAGIDIIDFDVQPTYWHTADDTLDKVDPRSLAVVGHVFVETLPELEKKFH